MPSPAADSLAQATHEHHDRLIPHVEHLARLAAMIDEGISPAFIDECEAEHRFIEGSLLPHMEAIETSLYPQLDRLMEGRHTMAPMRREHVELRRLVESAGKFDDLVTSGRLGPAEAIGLRQRAGGTGGVASGQTRGVRCRATASR